MGVLSLASIYLNDITNKTNKMFTIEDIKIAHSKVKSGADFPGYIKDIKALGVMLYETYVMDGHTDYYGVDNYKTATTAKYEVLTIADEANAAQFTAYLKAHQQGKTDYSTFCNDCAKSGIEKWVVDVARMTCTYYDTAGNEMLAEAIPQ